MREKIADIIFRVGFGLVAFNLVYLIIIYGIIFFKWLCNV